MRYLAIDLGDRRTGLALGDDVTRVASPLGVVVTAQAGERMKRIAKAIKEQGPDALVIGLPLHMDGSEGEAATKVRQIATQYHQRFGLDVHLVDERLSSATADQQMACSGLTHRQKQSRRDAVAAATILRDFFAQQDHPTSPD